MCFVLKIIQFFRVIISIVQSCIKIEIQYIKLYYYQFNCDLLLRIKKNQINCYKF